MSRLWGMRCKGGEKWGRVFKAKHHKCLHVTLESRISCVADGLVMCKLVSGLARGGGVSCTCGAPSWAMVSSCPCLCALYCSVISAILLARLGFISGQSCGRCTGSFSQVPFIYVTRLAISALSYVGIRNKLFVLGKVLNLFEPQGTHC